MKIFEVLDNPLPFRFSQRPTPFNNTYATFHLPMKKSDTDVGYTVRFEPIDDGIFLVSFIQRTTDLTSFKTKTSSNITNTGEQYKVFSTVKHIIERFTETIENDFGDIKGFIFSAVEPSRVKLYDRFVNLFSKSGFRFNHKEKIGKETYYAVAKNPEDLKTIVKYMESLG